jgi:hypothetical protein
MLGATAVSAMTPSYTHLVLTQEHSSYAMKGNLKQAQPYDIQHASFSQTNKIQPTKSEEMRDWTKPFSMERMQNIGPTPYFIDSAQIE